jgi:hypothetical protein
MTRKLTHFVREGSDLLALDTDGQLWRGSTTTIDEHGRYAGENHKRWVWEHIPGPQVDVTPTHSEENNT